MRGRRADTDAGYKGHHKKKSRKFALGSSKSGKSALSNRTSLASNLTRGGFSDTMRLSMTSSSQLSSHRVSTIGDNLGALSPCENDPFWEYYRVIGDLSRAEAKDLIDVMKFLSAEHIIRLFVKNWLQSRIKPSDLPCANISLASSSHHHSGPMSVRASTALLRSPRLNQFFSSHNSPDLYGHRNTGSNSGSGDKNKSNHLVTPRLASIGSEGAGGTSATPPPKDQTQDPYDFHLTSSTLMHFVQQSLKTADRHPTTFLIPYLDMLRNTLAIAARIMQDRMSSRHRRHDVFTALEHPSLQDDVTWNEWLNTTGITVFSYCDQTTYVRATLVCRAWFYASRYEDSRSHIRLRIKNVLRHLIDRHEVLSHLTLNGQIVVLEFGVDSKSPFKIYANRGKYTPENDMFLQRANSVNSDGGEFTLERMETKREGVAFQYFFSNRTQSIFSCIHTLQLDLTIGSQNSILYYVNEILVDGYWDVLQTLLKIETLQTIDLLLPDPHILIMAQFVKASPDALLPRKQTDEKSSASKPLSNGKNVKLDHQSLHFPAITIPPNKFCALSQNLKRIRFATKTLKTENLKQLLDMHFEHYYFNHDYTDLNAPYTSLHGKFVGKTLKAQRKKYRQNPVYKLCRSALPKAYLFDITPALHYLNRRPRSKCTSVEELTLVDVRCTHKELEAFLLNNSRRMKALSITYTAKCLNVHLRGHRPASSSISSVSGSNISLSNIAFSPTSPSSASGFIPGVNSEPSAAQMKMSQSSNLDKTFFQINEVFGAVEQYLRKGSEYYHQANTKTLRQIKQRNKHKKLGERKLKELWSKSFQLLPLKCLTLKFPEILQESNAQNLMRLFDTLSSGEYSEMTINRMAFEGGLLSTGMSQRINWQQVFSVQHVNTLILKGFEYSSDVFELFATGFASRLVRLDAEVIFKADDDSSLFESGDENSKSRFFRESGPKEKPIKKIFEALRRCHQLKYLTLDFVQHPRKSVNNYLSFRGRAMTEDSGRPMSTRATFDVGYIAPRHQTVDKVMPPMSREDPSSSSFSNMLSGADKLLMEPALQFMWIHQFFTGKHIKKTIKEVDIRFNELSVKKFEEKHKNLSKFKRFDQSHGRILRIDEAFTGKLLSNIKQWFGAKHCKQLQRFRLVRKLTSLIVFDDDDEDEKEEEKTKIDFADADSFAKLAAPPENNPSIVFFQIKKLTDGRKAEAAITGELNKLLLPEMPLG